MKKTMFEEDAKEYRNEAFKTYASIETHWKKGAEFGYNKGKKEIKLLKEKHKQSLKILTDKIEELHKANEWHYVKDGKYPTDEKDVEVLYQDCDKINTYNCIYDIHAKNWLYYNLDNMVLELFTFNVIAWKDIILPKLKEE